MIAALFVDGFAQCKERIQVHHATLTLVAGNKDLSVEVCLDGCMIY